MFLSNKYTDWYYRIILAAKAKGRCRSPGAPLDLHHIIPTSLGGDDVPENTVLLTHREHYVCHLLLLRMTTGRARSKMTYAFFRFSPKGSEVTSSKSYERFLRSARTALCGEGNSFFGRTHSAETRAKISQNHGMRGRYCLDVWVDRYGEDEAKRMHEQMLHRRSEALAGEKNPMFGRPRSEELKRRQSERMRGEQHPLFGRRFAWMTDGTSARRVPLDELMQWETRGWRRGRR